MLDMTSKFFFIIIFCCLYGMVVVPAQEQGEAEVSRGVLLPDTLRRPQRGEAPRYPRDTVIGALGQGEAPEGAYLVGRDLLSALLLKNREAAVLIALNRDFLEQVFKNLEPVNPQTYRLGGGREEPDGSVSFLFRFVGREQWIAGELYLMVEAETWKFDDLILEEAKDISAGGDGYRFDFSPYERFF